VERKERRKGRKEDLRMTKKKKKDMIDQFIDALVDKAYPELANLHENNEIKKRRMQEYGEKDYTKDYNRVYHLKLKMECFVHYGNGRAACVCCGENAFEFLCLDHIGGGGKKHLREIGRTSGSDLYRYLRKMGYPPGLRVLCHNCNMSLGFFGYCPHGMKLDA
jgi:hypothetical protein